MADNIIKFTPSPRPAAILAPIEHEDTPRQHGGRKRNPWRKLSDSISTATLVAGRLHRNESLRDWDFVPVLREGAENARKIADELDRLADEHGGEEKRSPTPRRQIEFMTEPEPEERHDGPRGNMHTFLFRSYDLIVEADEADLIRDVCCDIEKARRKLAKARQKLRSVREHFATQEQRLTTVDAKLSAAIVAALLSTVKQ